MITKKHLTLILPLFLFGCSVAPVALQPIGGSRSDGTLRMSYVEAYLTNATVDWESSDLIAIERCQKWGYSSAEVFGSTTNKCVSYVNGTCWAREYVYEYQCVSELQSSSDE